MISFVRNSFTSTQGAQDRTVSQFSTRHRGNIGMDTRTQTQWGVLRTVTSAHFQNENQTESFNIARAFIQWAGFTCGHSQSFHDTWGITDSWHFAQQQNNSDTGANGVNTIAYTFEFGNGITLTFGQQIALLGLMMVTSKGMAGVPRASLVWQMTLPPRARFQ